MSWHLRAHKTCKLVTYVPAFTTTGLTRPKYLCLHQMPDPLSAEFKFKWHKIKRKYSM